MVEGCVFGCVLYFDYVVVVGYDDVYVGIVGGVFWVIEIEYWYVIDDVD